jgi:hypothetical protein
MNHFVIFSVKISPLPNWRGMEAGIGILLGER